MKGHRFRVSGWALLALSVAIALISAVLQWPASSAVTVAVVAGILQVASGLLFQKDAEIHRPPDQVIESTTRRLGQISIDAVLASKQATDAADLSGLKLADAKAVLGVLSVRLDNLGENAAHVLRDWKFHPAAQADPLPPQPTLGSNQPDPNGGSDDGDQS